MLSFVFAPRGPLAARRMAAHRVVIAAAALTTLVAAAVGSALAVFAGQALPQAVRRGQGMSGPMDEQMVWPDTQSTSTEERDK